MKNLLIIISIFFYCISSAQVKDSIVVRDNTWYANHYEEKSVKNRKTARVLGYAAGGLVVGGIVTGVIIGNNERPGMLRGLEGLVYGGSIVTVGVLTGITGLVYHMVSNSQQQKSEKYRSQISLVPFHYQEKLSQTQFQGIGLQIRF